jgi:hypothetical protein
MSLNGRFQEENRQALCQTASIIKWYEKLKGLQIYKKREAAKAIKRCASTRRMAAYQNNGSQRQRPGPAGTDAPGAADRPSSSRL